MSKVFDPSEVSFEAPPGQSAAFDPSEVSFEPMRPDRPYTGGSGQRGQPPRPVAPAPAGQRGQPGRTPIPAGNDKRENRALDQSLLDPLVDVFGERVRPHLPGFYKQFLNEPMPVREAIGDAIRGLTTPENVAIMGGLGAANLTPLGPAVDVAAAGYFAKQMYESGKHAAVDQTNYKAAADRARKKGDENLAKILDERATKARANRVISSMFAALLVKGGAGKAKESLPTGKPKPTWFDKFVEDARKPQAEYAPEEVSFEPVAEKPAESPVEPPVVEPIPETATEAEATPEPIVATPEPEIIEPAAEAPAEPPIPRESTIQTFKEDYDALVQHPARGSVSKVLTAEEKAQQSVPSRLEAAAEEAPDHVVADYLDSLEEAAQLHHPDAMMAIDAAHEALVEGDRKKFARMAEIARQQMSSEYQKRVAQEAFRNATGEEAPSIQEPESASVNQNAEPEPDVRVSRGPAEGPYENDAEAVRDRLKDPTLYDKGLDITLSNGTTIRAIPLGGDRVAGELGMDIPKGDVATVLDALNRHTGFDSARVHPADKAGINIIWGEEAPRGERSVEAATKYGYRTEEPPKLKRTPAEDQIIKEGAAIEMQAWADSVDDARDTLKRGESAQTMESNYEGKQIEEAATKEANSIRSLGVKEGSPLEAFTEGPKELQRIIRAASNPEKANLTPKEWKLFREIYKAFDQAYEDTHLENIREYLTKADEQNVRELLGDKHDELMKGDEDISFDFGDSVIEKIDEFEERQKAALKDLIKGAATGKTAGMALPVEVLGRLAAIGAAKILKGTISFYQWAKEMRDEFGDVIESSTDLQKIWDGAMKRVEPLRGTTSAERKRLQGPIMEQLMETGELPPAGKLVIALERASTARRSLERAYTKERAQRAILADEVRRKIASGEMTAEQGQALLKSKFKGEMAADKKQFESLQLDQADVEKLFQQVAQHERFNVFDVMAANDGLQKVFEGRVPKASQIDLLKSVFGSEFAAALIEHQGLFPKLKGLLAETANLPRALMASMDMSAMLRQGVVFSFAHPIKYGLPAMREMFRQVFSPKNFKEWQEGVRKSPEYKLMQESGLYMADPLQLEGTLSAAEEKFASNLAEKIPIIGHGVKASERAYVAFLNKMRFDTFKQLSNQFISEGFDPADNIKPFRDLAKFVNNATGRGELGKLGRISEELSMTFFSPKLIAARFNMLNPLWYAKLEPRVRMEAIKTMGRFVGTGLTIVALAKLGGAKVETDSRSTDFAKIRVGDTRWDPWGGFQQWVRAFSQITSGYRKNTKGDIYKLSATEFPFETRWDVGERFLATKLAPVPQLAYELLHGQKMFGGEISLSKEAAENAVPLYLQDMKDAVNAMGPSAILTTGVPGFFGVGVQTYVERPPSSAIHSTIAEYISEPVTDALMKSQVSVGRVERLEKSEPSSILRLRSELTGKLINRRLSEVIQRSNYEKLPDAAKKNLAKAAMREARDQANSLSRRKFKTEQERTEFLKAQIGRIK